MLLWSFYHLPHTQHQRCCPSIAAPDNFHSAFKWKSAPSFISVNICCVCAIIMIASSEGHSHTSIALDTRTHTQLNSEQTLVSGLFQSALNYQLLVIKFIHGGSNTPTHTLSSTLRAWCLKELMGCKATIIEEWRANMAAAAGCWAHFAYHFHPPLLTLILSDVNVLSIMWGHLKGNCSNLVKDFCKVGVTDKKKYWHISLCSSSF